MDPYLSTEKNESNLELSQSNPNPATPGVNLVAIAELFLPNRHQSSEMLKLDTESYKKSLDYLCFKDLIAIGRTCKRLHQVVGQILHENYLGIRIDCEEDGIYLINWVQWDKFKFFHDFIHKICSFGNNGIQYVRNMQPKLHRLKELRLECADLSKISLDLPEILPKLEFLTIEDCTLIGNLQDFLILCQNLKRLILTQGNIRNSIIIGNSNDWMHQKYPMLENFELDTSDFLLEVNKTNYISELRIFLENNSNIQKLTIREENIRRYKDVWISSEIHLDELTLQITSDSGELCEILNELHEHGFYKRLIFYCSFELNQSTVDRYGTLNGLVKLVAKAKINTWIDKVSILKSIEELHIFHVAPFTDLPALPNSLTKLETIELSETSFEDILPFLREAVELKRFILHYLCEGTYFNGATNVIDLKALNKEREHLDKAQKITIFVHEDIYLATKWAVNGVKFELIELKRIFSHDFEKNVLV